MDQAGRPARDGLRQFALTLTTATLGGCLLTLDRGPTYRPPAEDSTVMDATEPPGDVGTDAMGHGDDAPGVDAARDVVHHNDVPPIMDGNAPRDVGADALDDGAMGTGDAVDDAPVMVRDAVATGDASVGDGGCVCAGGCDLASDTLNCGACGVVCTSGLCTAGVCNPIGDGADGPFTAPTAGMATLGGFALVVAVPSSSSVVVADAAPFRAASEVMVIDSVGLAAGTWEFARVASVGAGSTLMLAAPLANTYPPSDIVQVVRVLHFTSLTVPIASSIRTAPWNGAVGGVLPIRVHDTANVQGTLSVTGVGYAGGRASPGVRACLSGTQGGSIQGTGVAGSTMVAGAGGGGAACNCCGGGALACGLSSGGGGGGHGVGGAHGALGGTAACLGGEGGMAYGAADLSNLFFGAGGGSGGGNCVNPSGAGGPGGGVLYLAATSIVAGVVGQISADGVAGQAGTGERWEGAGGGGAGGSLYLSASALTITAATVHANGGAATSECGSGLGSSGAGGAGIVRIDCAAIGATMCAPGTTTATSPPATVVPL